MSFRFLHMADVHLDTAFKGRDRRIQSMLRESLLSAFRSAVDLAIECKVHAVLIAGDLFDSDVVTFATEKFLLKEFSRLGQADIKVFYAPGNHDPWDGKAGLCKIPWPADVHVFRSSQPERCLVFDPSGAEVAVVVGAGHDKKRETRNLAQAFPPADGGVPHVAVLHALVKGAKADEEHEPYAPCEVSDLTSKGYSYWALGHVHTRPHPPEGPLVVYIREALWAETIAKEGTGAPTWSRWATPAG